MNLIECGPIVAMVHGNAVVQSPELETKARPLGVGSLTVTFVAVRALLLLIESRNVTFEFGAAVCVKPLWARARSTMPVVEAGVVTVDESFVLLLSFVNLAIAKSGFTN